MNVYVNLRYSFLFISFLVIPLFKKCDDFDLFLAYLVFLFFCNSSHKQSNIHTISKPESKQSTKRAEKWKFGIQSKVFSFTLHVCNIKSTQLYSNNSGRSNNSQQLWAGMSNQPFTARIIFIKKNHAIFFLSRFSFKNTEDSQDSRGGGDLFNSLHKKWSFPLRIFPVNVTKFAVSCVFGHIYWRNP